MARAPQAPVCRASPDTFSSASSQHLPPPFASFPPSINLLTRKQCVSAREGQVKHGFMRGGIVGLLVVWTAHWLVAGWAYLQEHSIVVQQGFGPDGIQMWEIFNIKMVAAHHAIRWGAGAVAAGIALYLLRRRGGTEHAVSDASSSLASHASSKAGSSNAASSEALPA